MAFKIRATVPGSIGWVPTTGVGVQSGAGLAGRGVAQMRRNTSPSVMPAARCQRRSARTGQSSPATTVGDADDDALHGPVTLGDGEGDA
jgi:hypothetical protein